MEIDGRRVVLTYDPEIAMFRREFLGLTVGADFCADSVWGLRTEAEIRSRSIWICAEKRASNRAEPNSGLPRSTRSVPDMNDERFVGSHDPKHEVRKSDDRPHEGSASADVTSREGMRANGF